MAETKEKETKEAPEDQEARDVWPHPFGTCVPLAECNCEANEAATKEAEKEAAKAEKEAAKETEKDSKSR